MRNKTLDHHMGYFQYFNTTIYGKKGPLPFETFTISVARADFVLGAPGSTPFFSRRQQPTQTGIAADK
jgi:hypothetical protein